MDTPQISELDARRMPDNGHPFPSLLEECSFIVKFSIVALGLLGGGIWYLFALFEGRAVEALVLGIGLAVGSGYVYGRQIPTDRRKERSRGGELAFFSLFTAVAMVTSSCAMNHFQEDEFGSGFLQLFSGVLVASVLIGLYGRWRTGDSSPNLSESEVVNSEATSDDASQPPAP